jgi:hypothetical protein
MWVRVMWRMMADLCAPWAQAVGRGAHQPRKAVLMAPTVAQPMSNGQEIILCWLIVAQLDSASF